MLNIGKTPGRETILYSDSLGEKALHVMAEIRVLGRDPGSSKDRKVWFVLPVAPRGADWARLEAPPPLGPAPPDGSTCLLPPNFDAEAAIREAEESLDSIAPRLCAVQAFSNRHAKLLSEPGEEREAFVRRCADALERPRQEEEDRFRTKFKQKIERIREQRERESQKTRDEDEELRLDEREDSINDLEAGLAALFGGRRPSARLQRAATDASAAGTMRERIQSAEERPRAADQPMDFLEEQLRDLQTEMEAEARRIERKYREMAAEITGEILTPERRDFRIERLSLVWMGTNEVH